MSRAVSVAFDLDRRSAAGSSGESLEHQHECRPLHSPTLGVQLPKAKLRTLGTAAELIKHHSGRARVHGVVPKESPYRIERAILIVDANIINLDPVPNPDPIFRHGPISLSSINLPCISRQRFPDSNAIVRLRWATAAP